MPTFAFAFFRPLTDYKNAKFADFLEEMNLEEDGNLKRTYSSANAS